MKLINSIPTAHTQRIWVGGDRAQGLSFRHMNNRVMWARKNYLVSQCEDLPCGRGPPHKYIVWRLRTVKVQDYCHVTKYSIHLQSL